ncbi:MAG TPA: hypothetical protein VFE34_18790 [Dongiaceae bacterium]|jgi:hypothetical protein|nr:hypothetical protein [Dongiaceae bacterium]
MQYIRRRIQRVSGVTVRDERIESRDFSVHSFREGRDSEQRGDHDRRMSQPEAHAIDRIAGAHRQRT